MLRPNPIWLAILAIGVLSPTAQAAEQSCSSPTVPSLLPQTPPAASKKPLGEKSVGTGGLITVDADKSNYDVSGDTAIFTGHVVIRQGEREIKADQVQIDQKKNIKGQGGVDYTDPLVHILGAGGDYSPTGGADFKSGQFQLLQRPARGTAETMNLTPEGILNLKDVTFTTCPADDESWSLSADSIKLDTRAKIGEARDAEIKFKGVPILYLPWVSFPLGDERKSGFLFPTLGTSSRSGVMLSVPYYWNIAPNMDFTGEPIVFSRRGIDLGGDFRYLEPGSKGEFLWHYLPDDSVFGGSRSDVRYRDITDLTHDLRLSIDAENVSDPQYFQDFSQGPEGTSTAFVERRATLSYRDEHWRIDGEAQHFETIDNTLILANRPYARTPSLSASGDFGWGPGSLFRYGFDSEITNFDRDVTHLTNCGIVIPGVLSPCVTGWRTDIMPTASLNLSGPGYFVRPTLAYRATQYELDHTQPGEDKSPSRTLPIASLDTGLQFERDLGAGAKQKLTLEPRLLYLYVPYRNQNNLPVFDTALPDLVPVELFRNNRYVGSDRVSDADQVAMGVTSRFLDGHDGRQFLALTVGQIYYFETPKVVLPYEVPQTGTRSDFVTQLAINAFKNWNSNIGVQWNPQTSQTERADINIQYKPAPDKVINAAFRFERGTIHPASQCNIGDATGTGTGATNPSQVLTAAQYSQAGICGFEQVELSGAWPIHDHWNAFAREVYSLQDKQALESFAGFEYGACCWRVRFGARRYISRRPFTAQNGETGLPATSAVAGPKDTAAWLQLELTGLASVGSASDTFLIDEIRGYSPTDANSKLFKGP